jgi:hypothetical protein
MEAIRRQLWHRLTSRQIGVLTSIATIDGALLIALAYGILSAKGEVVLVVAPTYSLLFLGLACDTWCRGNCSRASP